LNVSRYIFAEKQERTTKEHSVKLQNRTVLITGGTSGIGLALAKLLHQRQNTIIVTGRDQGRLDALAHLLPGVHVVRSDVGSADAVTALHERVLAQFPALDTLVNNAGVMRNLNLNDPRDLKDVTREIEINLSGPVRMIQQFLPHLKSRHRALIVNVTSGLAFIPLPAAPVYCATKSALHSFTQSLRVQLGGSSVTVVELAPPAVQTPLIDREWAAEMAGQKLMNVDVLARHAIAGIEAGKLEIRPGLSNVLKAMSRIAPQFMFRQMAKMSKPPRPLLLDRAAQTTKAPR
jgi:uncharacterized oxidoreductase